MRNNYLDVIILQKILHGNLHLKPHYLLPRIAGALAFEKYKDKDDTEADAIKKYQKRYMVVQKLTTIGYTRTQIKALYPLIMQNLTAEEILAMFPPRSGVDEIKNLTKVFS